MSGKTFRKKFQVHYYEVNNHEEANIASVLNYFQETSISHSESIGNGVPILSENNLGWVIIQWYVEVKRYPVCGEEITGETWASGFNKFYATREFKLYDESGNTIAKATSLWILMDTSKRRPIRISSELIDAYDPSDFRAIDFDFKKFDKTEYEKVDSKEFYIRRSDIDTNGHVNNVKYAEWVLETIPEKVYNEYLLENFEIIYKKETTYGSMITSVCEKEYEDDEKYIFKSIISSNDASGVNAEARTIWRKREL